ncbi:MAG: dTDP-4-dehydrorhamnose reductase [Planctomycetes bacterium]|nr:dTDP-4-dehydrorhamnose reductase [Planctomycetota bacterium]NOG54000.1 dTDP-4-dehydrorhamnose reductase [Planctomycetota bacterium]
MIIGNRGMLGQAMCNEASARAVSWGGLDLPEFDLTDEQAVCRAIEPGCEVVINCAAYTDVDGAGSNEAQAELINATAAGMLARRVREIGAKLVHYSTDYVFDGTARTPYPTDHPRQPLGAYGRTKAKGEQLLEQSGVDMLLIRTSWLYAAWGKNFVRTIAKLASERDSIRVVNDQRGRPTSAIHLARLTFELLGRGAGGCYHGTDGGECTWYEFASEIVTHLGLGCSVEPCLTAEFPRPEPRPAYSVLDLSRTEECIGPMPHWTENLAVVLDDLKVSIA